MPGGQKKKLPVGPKGDGDAEQDKSADERKALKRAVARAAAAMDSQNWAEASQQWQAILDRYGERTPARAYAGLARATRRAGDHRMAAATAQAGLARFPDHPAVLAEAAEAAEAARDWPAAKMLWGKVVARPTRTHAPFVRLASLLSAAGDFAGAEDVVVRGLAQHGKSPQLIDLQADICFSTGRWREAEALFEKKVADPSTGEVRRNVAKVDASIARRLADIGSVITAAAERRASRRPRRIAVYSACIGGYDSLVPPAKWNDRFDYFVFVNEAVKDAGGLTVRPATFLHQDPTRTARYVKTHPHVLLGDYDVAIWVDSNLVLLDDLDATVDAFIASGRPVAGVPHQHRSSLSAEFAACIERAKDDPEVIERQRAAYRSIGFESTDLIETGWMMFNLHDERALAFLNSWWTEIEKHSRRDQLSVNYAMHTASIEWHRLLQPPLAIRNNPLVALAPHRISRKAMRLAEAMGATMYDPFAGRSYADAREARIDAITLPIDIVICVHDALDDVRLCLESVERHRRKDNVSLVLVDDGSGAETRDYLAGFSRGRDWVRLLRNDAAVGYSRAACQGVAASEGEFVIVLNSDTIVTDGWAEKLADALLSTTGAGVVGPLSNAAGRQSIPSTKGSAQQSAVNPLPVGLTPDDMNRHCEAWTVAGILPRVSLVHGFCIGIHRAVLDRIGFFDVENFPRGYGEEDDFCLRAGAAGFGLVIATHTFVFHAKSKSFEDEERIRLMHQGPATLARLHGTDRVRHAIEASSASPILQRLRQAATSLYDTPWPAKAKAPD